MLLENGVDVFEFKPKGSYELRKCKNVVLSPYVLTYWDLNFSGKNKHDDRGLNWVCF